MRRISLVILGTLVGATATSQQLESPTFDPRTIREAHLNSHTLPDGVAFYESARILALIAKDDPTGAAEYLADGSGLSVDKGADIVLLSLEARKSIDEEVAQRHNEIACTESAQPRRYGEDVYAIFERMDDLREEIANKHFNRTMATIGKGDDALFKQWLDIRKSDTKYIKFNFKEVYELSGESGDAVMADICLNLKGK